jgi:hypothetical protein
MDASGLPRSFLFHDWRGVRRAALGNTQKVRLGPFVPWALKIHPGLIYRELPSFSKQIAPAR